MSETATITITEKEALWLAYAVLASVNAHRDALVMRYAVPALMGQAKAIEATQDEDARKRMNERLQIFAAPLEEGNTDG